MYTLAQSAYLDSAFGTIQELPRVGSALENPYVFDASARELKAMASRGLVEIVEEHEAPRGGELLIDRLRFRRKR
jgi:hypothetical protein